MTEKDLANLMEAEEKQLGLHSPEFMQRHREIMETADRIHFLSILHSMSSCFLVRHFCPLPILELYRPICPLSIYFLIFICLFSMDMIEYKCPYYFHYQY